MTREVIVVFAVPFVHGLERARSGQGRTYDTPRNVEDKKAIWAAYERECERKYGSVKTAPKGVPVTVSVLCRKEPSAAALHRLERRARDAQDAGLRLGWHEPCEEWVGPPDADNVLKLVLDALNPVYRSVKLPGGKKRRALSRPGAWADDAQVTRVWAHKCEVTMDSATFTEVHVSWEEESND